MLTVYMKMLGPLTAERQILAIEALSVPHMKPDAAGRLFSRLTRRARRERPRSITEQLMSAMPVNQVPAKPKKTTKQKKTTKSKKVTDGG